MAYMNQERKAELMPQIKAVLKKYKLKGSVSVRNHSTLVCTIKSGPIDFIGNCNETCSNNHYQTSMGFRHIKAGYLDVNPYHFNDHFSGRARMALRELHAAMMDGNHDNSDIQTDYFDVGWYIDINIGTWNKHYVVE